jgi:hypothetical protein
MITEVSHREEWHITITPDDGETWPALPPYSSARYDARPDRIDVRLSRGSGYAGISLSGLRLKKDGTPGSLRVAIYDVPAWAAELVEQARSKHNLTREALTRDDE